MFALLAKCVIERRDAAKCVFVLEWLWRRRCALRVRDAFIFKLIALLRDCAHFADALSLFERSLDAKLIVGESKQFRTALISAFAARGRLCDAERIFRAMVSARTADAVAVSALMTALIETRNPSHCADAVRVFAKFGMEMRMRMRLRWTASRVRWRTFVGARSESSNGARRRSPSSTPLRMRMRRLSAVSLSVDDARRFTRTASAMRCVFVWRSMRGLKARISRSALRGNKRA